MKTIDVKGTLRAETGKKSTRELRKTDAVPCVLYGVEKDEKGLPVATPIAVTNAELRNLVYTPNIYLVNLAVDNNVCKAILKDIQFDPVKDTILHVRVEPDINSKVIAKLKPGTAGIVTEYDDNWCRIATDKGNITGYCSMEFLSLTELSKEEYDKAAEEMGISL